MGNKIVHIDFGGKDRKQIADWYSRIFDWELDHSADEMDYTMFKSAEGMGGGFISEGGPAIIPYISVTDVDVSVKQVTDAGGKVVADKIVTDMVTFALVEDPFGNKIGIVEDASNA